MGSALTCRSCNACGANGIWWEKQVTQRQIINTEVRNPEWADVCNSGNLVGVKSFHMMEPDIIDDPVDELGHTAIHIAVINKDRKLLEYILKHGVNVNAVGGMDQNTALHEAMLIEDEPAFQMHAIKSLFAFGIDDQMINLNGLKAIQLCPSSIRRDFQKAKRCRSELAVEADAKRRRHTPNPTMVAGMVINATSPGEVRRYIKHSDNYVNFSKQKREEIHRRENMLTAFGKGVGCEVDEIAFIIHQMYRKEKVEIWERFFHDQDSLQKLTDINRLMTSLSKKAFELRPKRKHKKPPQYYMHWLTKRIGERLPQIHRKGRLTKAMFVDGNHEEPPERYPDSLYSLLYQLHIEIVREEVPSMIDYGKTLINLFAGESDEEESKPFIGM